MPRKMCAGTGGEGKRKELDNTDEIHTLLFLNLFLLFIFIPPTKLSNFVQIFFMLTYLKHCRLKVT